MRKDGTDHSEGPVSHRQVGAAAIRHLDGSLSAVSEDWASRGAGTGSPQRGAPLSHSRLPLSPTCSHTCERLSSLPIMKRNDHPPNSLPGKLPVRRFKGSELRFPIPYIKCVLTYSQDIPSPETPPVLSPHSCLLPFLSPALLPPARMF